MLGSWQIAHQPVMPRPGWVEHEPEVILANTLGCIDHVMAEMASQGVELAVKGLGITNQRETTLAWDRTTGEALCNAISWNDLRTSELSARLAAEHGGKDALRATTGLPFSTYFAALKIKWLMENDAKVQAAVAAGTCCFGTVDSWLIYKLTGGAAGGAYVTDVTNASRYLLMDLASLAWDPACLALFGLTEAMLPRIVSCAEPYGPIAAGPLQGVPVCGCVGDQQASTLGQRCKVGEAKVRTLRPLCSRRSGPLWAALGRRRWLTARPPQNTYGTGLFLLMNTGEQIVASTHGLLSTVSRGLRGPAPPRGRALTQPPRSRSSSGRTPRRRTGWRGRWRRGRWGSAG